MTRHGLTVLLVLAIGPAAAQRTWIVDPYGRPGFDFTSLDVAIQSVNPGDCLLIRDGAYFSFTVNRGLTLDFHANSVLSQADTITIANVPAGEVAVIRGLTYGLRLQIQNNLGTVILERNGPRTEVFGSGFQATTVTASAQVHFTECGLDGLVGRPALTVSQSQVSVNNCFIRGHASAVGPFGPFLGGPGIQISTSTLIATGSVCYGGTVAWQGLPAFPAIVASQSRLELRAGRFAASIAAVPAPPVPAVLATFGTVLVTPWVQLEPTPGHPAIGGSAVVTTAPSPALTAAGAAPGNVLRAMLRSMPNDIAVFFVGRDGTPIDLGAVGTLWFDPSLFVTTGNGVVGTVGALPHSVPLPADPQLGYGAWVLQSVAGNPASGFQLSGPAVCTFR